MNQLLEWLKGGDIRSDGDADRVGEAVLANPELFDDLLAGLLEEDVMIRGRASHALERVSRDMPELFIPHLPDLLTAARRDPLPMVRWHLAMLFANLLGEAGSMQAITETLLQMLQDESVFVRSWVISSLAIVARLYPHTRDGILNDIERLRSDRSIAIRARAGKAIAGLLDESKPLPRGWVKSKRIEVS